MNNHQINEQMSNQMNDQMNDQMNEQMNDQKEEKAFFRCTYKKIPANPSFPLFITFTMNQTTTLSSNEIMRCTHCKSYLNCYCEIIDPGYFWRCNLCDTTNETKKVFIKSHNSLKINEESQKTRLEMNACNNKGYALTELTTAVYDIPAPANYVLKSPPKRVFVFLIENSVSSAKNSSVGVFEKLVELNVERCCFVFFGRETLVLNKEGRFDAFVGEVCNLFVDDYLFSREDILNFCEHSVYYGDNLNLNNCCSNDDSCGNDINLNNNHIPNKEKIILSNKENGNIPNKEIIKNNEKIPNKENINFSNTDKKETNNKEKIIFSNKDKNEETKCLDKFKSRITYLLNMNQPQETSDLLTGLLVAKKILQRTGGSILAFISSLQNIKVEDLTVQMHYFSISVSFFLFPNTNINLHEFSVLPKKTGGMIFYYPNFCDSLPFKEKLHCDLETFFGQGVFLEGIMRIRPSRGTKVKKIYGNFSFKNDVLSFCNFHLSHNISFEFEVEKGNGSRTNGSWSGTGSGTRSGMNGGLGDVSFQAALLGTFQGRKIIRVFNFCVRRGDEIDVYAIVHAYMVKQIMEGKSMVDAIKSKLLGVSGEGVEIFNERLHETISNYNKHISDIAWRNNANGGYLQGCGSNDNYKEKTQFDKSDVAVRNNANDDKTQNSGTDDLSSQLNNLRINASPQNNISRIQSVNATLNINRTGELSSIALLTLCALKSIPIRISNYTPLDYKTFYAYLVTNLPPEITNLIIYPSLINLSALYATKELEYTRLSIDFLELNGFYLLDTGINFFFFVGCENEDAEMVLNHNGTGRFVLEHLDNDFSRMVNVLVESLCKDRIIKPNFVLVRDEEGNFRDVFMSYFVEDAKWGFGSFEEFLRTLRM